MQNIVFRSMRFVLLATVVCGGIWRVPAAGVSSSAATPPPADEPRIFIGTAWQDRLDELRDKSRWREVAPHVGLFVHPNNINPGSEQLNTLKAIAPHFGVRHAVIERNSVPTGKDCLYRIRLMRSMGFTELYYYMNVLFPENEKVTATTVPSPDPRIYDRARYIRSLGVKPLFGLTPHVVFVSEKGFEDRGWNFLRDFSVFGGYCYDAPAELYTRTGKTERQKANFERYRVVTAESIRYATGKHMISIYLLGSHGTAEENIRLAREVVRDLKRRNALPWAWGIEDYTTNSQLHMTPERNADGTPANTVTGLALWIREFYAGKVE